MDYYGDDPYPTANTPGLIVDDVSLSEATTYFLANSLL